MVHSVTAHYVSDRFLLLFKRLNAFSILSLLLTVISAVSVFYCLNQLRLASEHRLQSYTLSEELRHSSDQLTMMARAYAATENKAFKHYFDQVLAIRNGSQARPAFYHRVYWDFKMPGVKNIYGNLNAQLIKGELVAFDQMLAELELTKEEKRFLSAAKLESDSLTQLENKAFQLIQIGKGPQASDLLYSDEYFSAKANIMANINEFHRELESRSESQVDLWLEAVYMAALLFIISILILLALLVYKSYIRSRLDGSILEMLNEEVSNKTTELSHNNDMLKTAIDDLTLAQEKLIESEKMSLLGGLVAGVAHEINTPIGVGITAISSQKEEVARLQAMFDQGAMNKSDFKDFIEHLKASNDVTMSNLYRIVDLITVFKKLSVEQDLDEKIPIELHKYIEDIIDSIRSSFKHETLIIENQVDSELSFISYPGAIAQILTNLLKNCDLHAFINDNPYNDSNRVKIAAEKHAGSLVIIVSDNGQGMPKEVVEKIFDPFYSYHKQAHGTGLGMNIVYTLVTQKLLGKIECESGEGQGTRIKIEFPI